MTPSPRLQSNFSLQPWQNNSCSLPPKKWTIGVKDIKINKKMMPSQKSSIIFNNEHTAPKTQPKFYQKTHKKMQNSIYKQRIQSIKPISFNEYEQNQFIIEPRSKRKMQQGQQETQNNNSEGSTMHTPCIGLINPMYINVKCNPKRLANSCQLTKQKELQAEMNAKSMNRTYKKMYQTTNIQHQDYNQSAMLPVKKENPSDVLYFRIVSEMNEYFNSMKLMSFKNNKTQQMVKRSIKSHSEKRDLKDLRRQPKILFNKNTPTQDDDNLNIIGLRPISSDYQKINRNSNSNFSKSLSKPVKQKESQNSSKIFQNQFPISQTQSKTQIALHLSKITPRYDILNEQPTAQSLIICHQIIASPLQRLKQKRPMTNMRPMTHDVKRSFSPKKNKYKGFCFGEINNPKNTPDEVYRLKVLYYKDLLWKNGFNLGVRYVNKNEESSGLKYFVGKGNNSKLIKTLMAKRWWWSLDSKEENSNFVWTQLKIYSIYEKQPNLSSSDTQNPQLTDIQAHQINLFSTATAIQPKPLQPKPFIDNSSLIINHHKKLHWQSYINIFQNQEREKKITEQNLSLMRKRLEKNLPPIKSLESPAKMTNHLEFSRTIGNKKALYRVMMLYLEKVKKCSPDQIFVPLTYHITAGLEDQEYLKFLTEYYRRNKSLNKTCWIVKPGQLTNRGRGITYCKDLNQIKPIIKKKQTHPNGSLKTFLIQEYLDRPLLYKGRKFDIRHYIMISSINGKLRGYFYQGGYIRTTSYKYKLDDNSPAIHLTNDAVQKYCKDYGKYQKGNKLSYQEFDEYLQEKYPAQEQGKKIGFFNTIHPQIRKISTDVMHAAYYFVDPNRKVNNFQIFGLDIMVDESLKCYLIEVNTNPCLQLSSPVLKSVIPQMLDNAFALTLDCCYPPPEKQPLHQYHKKYKYPISLENKFELVFDEDIHGREIEKCYQKEGIETGEISGIGDDDQNFESCEEDNEDY